MIMARMRAGQAVVEALRAEGIDHIFGIVGWTINSVVTELYGRGDIRFVDTRHEEGAAFMAYGYARASGKPAACLTTAGASAINLLTGISLAYKGRAPVVAIAGNVAGNNIGRDGHQEFDLVGLFKPVTYLSREVNQTGRVLEQLRRCRVFSAAGTNAQAGRHALMTALRKAFFCDDVKLHALRLVID
jgi:acetolactate synthase-1/2/3 large subunit